VRKYLRLVLIKDTPWWLLFEDVLAVEKSHACSGWESGLCLRGAAGLLRKLAAALQRETGTGSRWSRRFSLLWALSLSSLSTTSPCIRSLSISHTASYTASNSAQAAGLTLLTVAPWPQGLFLYRVHVGLNIFFFLLCLLSSDHSSILMEQAQREGPGVLPTMKLSLEVDQKKASRALSV